MFFVVKISLFSILLFSSCKKSPDCSPFDASCSVIGYIIPSLLNNTNTDRFSISTIAGPRSITITWAIQQGVTNYKIYAKSTPGVTNKDPDITGGGTSTTSFTENFSTLQTRYYRVSYTRSGTEILSQEKSTSIPTGRSLHFISESITANDNTVLTQWLDESGNNYHLGVNASSCTTGGTFRTNVFNGKPVVRFSNVPANTNCMNRPTGNPLLNNNGSTTYAKTVFLVLRTTNTAQNTFFSFANHSTSPVGWSSIYLNTLAIRYRINGQNNILSTGLLGDFLGGNFTIISFLLD
jgi:hypothetical protein